jgi:hypothetical protein
MFSMALLITLNCLDFCALKGQSHNNVCLCKILWGQANEHFRIFNPGLIGRCCTYCKKFNKEIQSQLIKERNKNKKINKKNFVATAI